MIRARLSDAKFFYETDLKTRLEDRLPKFEQIVFHEKLGTQAERIARIEALAGDLAPLVGADVGEGRARGAARKADLLTEVVGEFPEVQGLMGNYYARGAGRGRSRRRTPSRSTTSRWARTICVPTDPVSIAVALADKLDILTGFWAIDEKPTGSKDPYALRRAALGVIRLVLDNKLAAAACCRSFAASGDVRRHARRPIIDRPARLLRRPPEGPAPRAGRAARSRRCRVRAAKARTISLLIVRRVEALGKFLDTDDGKNLLAGTKRAANILRIEEKKDNTRLHRRAGRARSPAGRGKGARPRHRRCQGRSRPPPSREEDFAAAMTAMAKLRPHVDAFFDKVTVNVDDKALRENRLQLLNEIREATRAVADFSKIEG